MAGGNLIPNSYLEAVTSVTHMLLAFENFVKTEFTGINVIYDQELSYESGIQKLIEDNHYNASEKKPDPVLIYNRTITEDSQFGLASRARNTTGKLKTAEGVLKYSCAYSEYDLNFLYVTHSMKNKEGFEVSYNSNSGISAIREIVVDMPELGEFKYFVTPLPLTEIEIVSDNGVTYKAIGGIMRVRGFFFVLEGTTSVIKEINSKIYSVARIDEKNKNIEQVADIKIEE